MSTRRIEIVAEGTSLVGKTATRNTPPMLELCNARRTAMASKDFTSQEINVRTATVAIVVQFALSLILLVLLLDGRRKIAELSLAGATLRAQNDDTITRLRSVLSDGRHAVQAETAVQMANFVTRAEARLKATTVDVLRTRKLIILDDKDAERIELGAEPHESPASWAYISLSPASGTNRMYLKIDDLSARMVSNDRLYLSSESGGASGLMLCKNPEAPKSAVAINYTPSTGSVLVIRNDAGTPRLSLGVNAEAIAWSQINDSEGTLVYGVQAGGSGFPETFLKKDAAATAWDTAATFSTIKTFYDIITKP
jgi:hypothetical protein